MIIGREPISKRLRFEVFKRDRFTCQYCGRKPPDVVLHCDHLTPVSANGSTDSFNLITSCEDCNLGKSANELPHLTKRILHTTSCVRSCLTEDDDHAILPFMFYLAYWLVDAGLSQQQIMKKLVREVQSYASEQRRMELLANIPELIRELFTATPTPEKYIIPPDSFIHYGTWALGEKHQQPHQQVLAQ